MVIPATFFTELKEFARFTLIAPKDISAPEAELPVWAKAWPVWPSLGKMEEMEIFPAFKLPVEAISTRADWDAFK